MRSKSCYFCHRILCITVFTVALKQSDGPVGFFASNAIDAFTTALFPAGKPAANADYIASKA